MHIPTNTLVTHAVDKIKNGRDIALSKKTPSHLAYDIRRIEHKWSTDGILITSDLEFLTHIYVSTDRYLSTHTYMLGEWHSIMSSEHTTYNLHSKKRSKRSEALELQYKARL